MHMEQDYEDGAALPYTFRLQVSEEEYRKIKLAVGDLPKKNLKLEHVSSEYNSGLARKKIWICFTEDLKEGV